MYVCVCVCVCVRVCVLVAVVCAWGVWMLQQKGGVLLFTGLSSPAASSQRFVRAPGVGGVDGADGGACDGLPPLHRANNHIYV